MKIFGWEVTNNIAISVGAVVSGGACYAILKYLLSSTGNFRTTRRDKLKSRETGEPDLSLPLFLEQEYGSFRKVCLESGPTQAQYLQEIPDSFFIFPQNFLSFITSFVTEHTQRYRRALVVGSRTGYLVFALGEIFDEIKGVESSFSQVVTCYQFQNLASVTHQFPFEGPQKTISRTFKSPIALGGPFPQRRSRDIRNKNKEKIEFVNADVEKQPLSYFGDYQLVVIQNCLEDLENPVAFLETLKNIICEGGYLIISGDYNWSKKLQLQAKTQCSGLDSFGLLKLVLNNDFKLEKEKDIPEILCDSVRSCKIRNNHVTAWTRVKSTKKNDSKV